MIVGTTGDHIKATLDKHLGHRPGIGYHLGLIGLEFWLQCLLEGHRLGGDHVHQRAALGAREHQRVQFLFEIRIGLGQDDPPTRTAQGLVGGRGGHIGDLHRAGINPGGDQASHVGHVDKQPGTHLVGDLAETLPVHHTGIGRETGHDHLGLVFHRQALDLFVVDVALLVDPVLHRMVDLAGEVDLGTVGQVTTMGQRHA